MEALPFCWFWGFRVAGLLVYGCWDLAFLKQWVHEIGDFALHFLGRGMFVLRKPRA